MPNVGCNKTVLYFFHKVFSNTFFLEVGMHNQPPNITSPVFLICPDRTNNRGIVNGFKKNMGMKLCFDII